MRGLERVETLTDADVAIAFQKVEQPLLPAWLEFHQEFAGYVFHDGRERLELGLVVEEPVWLPAGLPEVTVVGDSKLVACADAHPSFDYALDQHGEFSGIGGGGPCETFAKHVEQMAILQNVSAAGFKPVFDYEQRSRKFRDAVALELSLSRDQYASDKYTNVRLSSRFLIFERGDKLSIWCK